MNDLNKAKLRALLKDIETVVRSMTNRRRSKISTISKSKIARVTNHRLMFEIMAANQDEKTAKAGTVTAR